SFAVQQETIWISTTWPITRSSRTNPRRRTAATTRIHKTLRVAVHHSVMDSRNPGQAASSRLAGSRVVRSPAFTRSGIVVTAGGLKAELRTSCLIGTRVVRAAILVILFSAWSLQDAAAHDPGLSSLTIQQRTNSLEATLTLAVKDAARVAELDEDNDGRVTQAEFEQTRSQLETAVTRQLFIAP